MTTIHCIDVETTGFLDDDPNHEVLSCAIFTWTDGAIAQTYQQYYRPLGDCDPGAARVNGFVDPDTWGQGKGGSVLFDAREARRLLPHLEQVSLWCGSNPEFDVRFLKRMFARCRVPWPKQRIKTIDTATLALWLQLTGKVKSTSLGNLCEYFQLPPQDHSAEGDARASAIILDALIKLGWQGFQYAP